MAKPHWMIALCLAALTAISTSLRGDAPDAPDINGGEIGGPPPLPSAYEPDPTRLALGVGYPDLRARLGLGLGWNVEAKAAFADGEQVYAGRAFWDFADLGPLKVMAGGEGGWTRFDGIDTVNGTGYYGEAFVGLEYPFAHRLRLSVDVGPAWLQAGAEGQSVSSTELIYSTALYLFVF
jgi:hypothetical protein